MLAKHDIFRLITRKQIELATGIPKGSFRQRMLECGLFKVDQTIEKGRTKYLYDPSCIDILKKHLQTINSWGIK